ncbi:MAG: hypothetical protein WAZ97_25865 [Pseudolabrys sp.]
MNLKLTVAILVIAVVPLWQAQKPSAAIVTHADARKVLEIIKGDRVKTETYCDMVKLGHEMAAADEKKADELNQKMGELQKKLGPEYAALMDAFQDVDLGSEVGQEISSMFAALRQRDHPLRPRAQVSAFLERHARPCEATARTGRPLRSAARVHAQVRDPHRFGAARRA